MVETANTIWADGPLSLPTQPDKAQIRAWGTWVETSINAFLSSGGKVYSTRSALYADLSQSANTMAWVLGDPTVEFNGIYRKNGSAGSGSWTRVGDLPYSYIVASNNGSGTANAVQATTSIPVSDSSLILINFTAANTGAMTVSFNGGSPLSIKSNSGNDIAPGGVQPNMLSLGRKAGSTFRIVTDQVSSAVVAQAEAAAADANIAASSLLFRIYPDVATAQAATIAASAAYIAIASYSPQPRFYKRFASDPGSGDRFQSADGAWWQGLPLPGTTFDFANPVLRSGNVTIGTSDFDQVHLWSIPVGTTYTATLPDPDTHIGRAVHLEVDATSRGILAFSCPDPIGKFTATELVIWAGESLTLIARAGRWEIAGGVCKPLQLFATNPGANIAVTWVANSGWTTTQQGGEEWAISAGGQIITPRSGYYTSSFKTGVSWSAAPTFVYTASNNNSGLAIHRNQINSPAGSNAVLPVTRDQSLAKGAAISPVVIWSGGTSVVVERATFGAPELALKETPQW